MNFLAGAVVLSAVALGSVLSLSHRALPASTFEYGVTTQFEGIVREAPHPTLLVGDDSAGMDSYLLVAEGKHGANALVYGLERLRGRQ